jgi:ABC-type multidrug transport system fused ATPase/permease subunit
MYSEKRNPNGKLPLEEYDSSKRVDSKEEENGTPQYPRIGFFKMQYTFADRVDLALLTFACLGSLIAGAAMPLISLLLGKVINQFNGTIAVESVPGLVKGLIINFILAGIGIFLGSFMMIFFWTVSGRRLANKINKEYFRVIMRQKQTWFDKSDTYQINTRVFNNMQTIESGVKIKIFIKFLDRS